MKAANIISRKSNTATLHNLTQGRMLNTQSDSEEEPEVYIQTRLRPRTTQVNYREFKKFDAAILLEEDDK